MKQSPRNTALGSPSRSDVPLGQTTQVKGRVVFSRLKIKNLKILKSTLIDQKTRQSV